MLVLFSLIHMIESILITVTKGPNLQPFKILYVPKISEAGAEWNIYKYKRRKPSQGWKFFTKNKMGVSSYVLNASEVLNQFHLLHIYNLLRYLEDCMLASCAKVYSIAIFQTMAQHSRLFNGTHVNINYRSTEKCLLLTTTGYLNRLLFWCTFPKYHLPYSQICWL